jgi:hypothetical protein
MTGRFEVGDVVAGRYRIEGEHDEASTASRKRATVPDELDRVIAKCLCKDRAARYQDVDALAQDLWALLDQHSPALDRGIPLARRARLDTADLPTIRPPRPCCAPVAISA